ncbi:hypothetical protein ACP70R_014627 [Stipagrostis hirtigluma subsp. patula]
MARPAPELMDDLVEEVLIRCPPDDPARLVRAALVCKPWCRVVSGAGFRRRYRQLHRSPPMLGIFNRGLATRFVPTTSFRPSCADLAARCHWWAVDARHGHILFCDMASRRSAHMDFIVSNPIIGELRKLPSLQPLPSSRDFRATLLCRTDGCDHLDCPFSPFIVVYLVIGSRKITAFVYSSETGMWSETASIELEHPDGLFLRQFGTLAGNALYFLLHKCPRILEYDVGKQELSVVSLPSECCAHCLTTEDGRLGFATVQEEELCMWSRLVCQNGWEWVQRRVIKLKNFPPISDVPISCAIFAFVDDVHIVFWNFSIGIFDIHLKSGCVTKVGEITDLFQRVTPYMSFYTPSAFGAASTCEGLRASTSDASQS